MCKYTKNGEETTVIKRGLVATLKPEPDFPRRCGFREVLDNDELITLMEFQNILMTGCRDMGKKLAPQMGVVTKIFFQNSNSVTFYPNNALTSCKNRKKLMSGLQDIQRRTDVFVTFVIFVNSRAHKIMWQIL